MLAAWRKWGKGWAKGRNCFSHWSDEAEAGERFAEAIGRIRELTPEAEMAGISPGRGNLPLPWAGIRQGTSRAPSRVTAQHAGDRVWSGSSLYSQVPAFSVSDRVMIDVLETTRGEGWQWWS